MTIIDICSLIPILLITSTDEVKYFIYSLYIFVEYSYIFTSTENIEDSKIKPCITLFTRDCSRFHYPGKCFINRRLHQEH